MIITLGNSSSTVSDVDQGTNYELMNLLSYKSEEAEYRFHKLTRAYKYLKDQVNMGNTAVAPRLKKTAYLLNKASKERVIQLYENGQFPTGLLYLIEDFCVKKNIKPTIRDLRIVPSKPSKFFTTRKSLPPLRYYQKAIVEACLNRGRGVVEAATGSGKTLCIVKLILERSLKTLIIVPSKELNDMFCDSMIDYFGKGKVEKLTTKTTVIKKDIAIANIQTLAKMDAAIFKDIDMVIIDESHRGASDSYQDFNKNCLNHCYYRFLFTATYFRNDNAELALHGMTADILYKYSTKQALLDKVLTPPEFRLLEFSNHKGKNYQIEYKNGVVLSMARNILIADVVNEHKNAQILILVQQVEHGDELLRLVENARFLHGSLKNSERTEHLQGFRDKEFRVLIGTDGCLGEGVDIPCVDVLILANGGKAKSRVIQNVGRALRLYPGKTTAYIYDIIDMNTNYLETHARLRREVYEDYECPIMIG